MSEHAGEVIRGERFKFGANWRQFLSVLNDERIEQAKASLKAMLEVESLQGKTFLDVGSGSGLFSLAARMLGAKVHSFDYDPQSVACTQELRRRYYSDDPDWRIEEGSALDVAFMKSLGQFDVVYSWGVLHHTGRMWDALANVAPLVRDSGVLFISIYNDQGGWSKRWHAIKQIYNRLPRVLKPVWFLVVAGVRESRSLAGNLARMQLGKYIRDRRDYAKVSVRGMSYWHDLVDWIGGYPFEVAKPEEIFDFFRRSGFVLARLKTCGGGLGCNEFVFHRPSVGAEGKGSAE